MNAIDSLAQAGTVTWLDDLSRDRIETGNLAEIITTKSVVGVTTNPAILAAAMSHGTAYDAQIAELKAAGTSADRLAGLLCYRVLEAHGRGQRYTLILPGQTIPPQNGQREKCLAALAVM